jgi:ribosomal protein S18
MAKIKLYDEKDLDYYNPKPFVLNMVSLFGEEDHKRLYSWIDGELKHLFEGSILKNNFLDIVKNNELDHLIKDMKQILDRKAENLEQEVRDLERKIKRCQEMAEENLKDKDNYTTQLEGLKNVIAKATRPNN